MSPETTMDDPNNTDIIQPDPLLKPGAFIDPNPPSNNNGVGSNPTPPDSTLATPPPANQKTGPSGPVEVTDPANRPEWLPVGWVFREILRTSGATAGTKDKYFIEPSTNSRFRSKKEVFNYLETGVTPKMLKRKNADSEADNTPQPKSQPKAITETPKRKKTESKAKNSMKNFNFDEVPTKVKWVMTDVFEGAWRPLLNGVERVPESSKQEWAAAFTYLTLQNGSRSNV